MMKKLITFMVLVFAFNEISLAITKKAIKPSELPAVIITDIKIRYPSALITDAFQVNNKNILSFEVIINFQHTQSVLYYDVKGNFIRKTNVKGAYSQKPVKKNLH